MKSIIESKKFWFNFLTIVTVIAGYYGYTPDQTLIKQVGDILVMTSPLVNLILTMFFTKSPISITGN